MRDIYYDFAEVYDRLQDIDYDSFINYYLKIFKKFNLNPKLVLDLACGTGNITIPLAKRGYDMIGIDISDEMLRIAREKAEKENLDKDILFLNQDMTEFELYGTVDAIICALDGVNYLTEDDDLNKLFPLIKNYLNPDGIFIMDVNTPYKLSKILNDNTFIYDNDGAYCVWNSEYIPEDKICDFYLDFFIENEDKTYTRKSEVQSERAYNEEEIKLSATNAGLKFLGVYDDRTDNVPTETSQRVFYVFQK